ncbi:hypothetical protein C0J52_16948 [Blattella germanica]|nr:hypothetical protein C0J52_16948 [Blattella germanica]
MKLSYILVIGFMLCGVMADGPAAEDQQQNEVEDDGKWKIFYRLVKDCARKPEMSSCLKIKAVVFLDRALGIEAPIRVNDYISLAREPSKDGTPKGRSMKQPLSETQLEESLPKTEEERNGRLDELLQEKVDSFLQSRSLQLNFPTDVFEGRKKKKGGYLLAGGLAMAGMMAQAFMGKIALIAGKALLVAKIALVISAIVGLKKLVGGGGGGGGHDAHQVVYASGGHEHGGWSKRSLSSDPFESHDLAYRAHKTEINNSGDD